MLKNSRLQNRCISVTSVLYLAMSFLSSTKSKTVILTTNFVAAATLISPAIAFVDIIYNVLAMFNSCRHSGNIVVPDATSTAIHQETLPQLHW